MVFTQLITNKSQLSKISENVKFQNFTRICSISSIKQYFNWEDTKGMYEYKLQKKKKNPKIKVSIFMYLYLVKTIFYASIYKRG